MWNIIGKITVLLFDFNAITISEIAGMDNDIALAPFNNTVSNLSKIDMHTSPYLIELPTKKEIKKQVVKSNLTRHSVKKTHKRPIVRDDTRVDPNYSFGLDEFVPGFKYLFTLGAPTEIARGVINGSRVSYNSSIGQCDKIVSVELIGNLKKTQNLTLSIV